MNIRIVFNETFIENVIGISDSERIISPLIVIDFNREVIEFFYPDDSIYGQSTELAHRVGKIFKKQYRNTTILDTRIYIVTRYLALEYHDTRYSTLDIF